MLPVDVLSIIISKFDWFSSSDRKKANEFLDIILSARYINKDDRDNILLYWKAKIREKYRFDTIHIRDILVLHIVSRIGLPNFSDILDTIKTKYEKDYMKILFSEKYTTLSSVVNINSEDIFLWNMESPSVEYRYQNFEVYIYYPEKDRMYTLTKFNNDNTYIAYNTKGLDSADDNPAFKSNSQGYITVYNWYRNGVLHREGDNPAVIVYRYDIQETPVEITHYSNGKKHRDKGPARSIYNQSTRKMVDEIWKNGEYKGAIS